jgi:hypothetical protein
MKRFSLYWLFLGLCVPAAAHSQQTGIIDLYKARSFDAIVQKTSASALTDLPDESLYYRVLSATQLGKLEVARAGLADLFKRDADYYRYKLSFDTDLMTLAADSNVQALLKELPSEVILDQRRSQQLVVSGTRLRWFRNGIALTLSDTQGSVRDARFLDEKVACFVTEVPPVNKRDTPTTHISFYNAPERTMTASFGLPGAYASYVPVSWDKMLFQTAKGFQIFNNRNFAALSPFLEGQFLAQDKDAGKVSYTRLDPRTRKSESLEFQY